MNWINIFFIKNGLQSFTQSIWWNKILGTQFRLTICNIYDEIIVNGKRVYLDFSLTCKDTNVIYIAQCTVCNAIIRVYKEDTYFGQTVTSLHERFNGHRRSFSITPELLYEKSGLSMHCFLEHKNLFNLNLFKVGMVKKVAPLMLDREENRVVEKYQTNIWGINRIAIVR